MDFVKSLFIAASGLRAQNGRMRVIAENIANASSTGRAPGEDPYRRKIATFQSELDRSLKAEVVRLGPIEADQSDFGQRYEPGHPAADENGYVLTPNVNSLIETVDMQEAQRSYEANLNVIQTTRRMLQRTFEILRA
ncbi:flagellar basal body rod protein FlgC [Stappia sp. F7233]|uniref:Flagellar basal-body rod protein FlgC n=1 Tax=Stappia albiluteola TaxID=2758565 RepID=A0A839AK78_9HYPH|nr:flagellar basal body rod protein FlgC [Stappia albiluteola]MBA5779292.1 flagellar basal body rod protein FlgC [Stappia albiluteola]